ncbi:MAG: hypothetical protein Q9160_005256 [Pyrenula sp. 1 TL-2023]
MSDQPASAPPKSRSFKNPSRNQTGLTINSGGTASENKKNPPRRLVNYGDATHWELAQVAQAATAAELYFPPVTVKEQQNDVTYSDGGFSNSNNPTIEGIKDIQERWGDDMVGIVVSVGTARHEQPPKSKRWTFPGRVKEWADRMTDPEPVHIRAEELSDHNEFGFPYYRFTAMKDLALKITLDEWKPRPQSLLRNKRKAPGYKTMDEIDKMFLLWARDYTVQDQLNRCAEQLVQARKLRMQREAEWERFAVCAKYECGEQGCDEVGVFYNKDTFQAHIAEKHPCLMEEMVEEHSKSMLNKKVLMEMIIKKRRKKWAYKPKRETQEV